jgi:hypothetical protein
VPTPFEKALRLSWAVLLPMLAGCGGEPSDREVQNARAFEALLTAVSLKDPKELEGDARLIEARHDSGELSDPSYRELFEVIEKGRAKDWAGAERRAYEFRARFGDAGAYFR